LLKRLACECLPDQSVIRPELLGVYVNPDEIEAEIKQFDFLDFDRFEIQTEKDEVFNFSNLLHFWKKLTYWAKQKNWDLTKIV
jgi:hypothetical protein